MPKKTWLTIWLAAIPVLVHSQIFSEQQVITITADWAQSVYATDLDGDGDMDVLSASWNDTIVWYESLTIPPPGVYNNSTQSPAEFRLFHNYLNPFNETTTISFHLSQ